MIRSHALAALATLAVALPAAAQPPGRGPDPRAHSDPFGGALFPPELVMRHADELGVDSEQRERIIAEIQSVQSGAVPLQWRIREETEKLRALLERAEVDEKAALGQAERVIQLEGEAKRSHLTMLIRIKNTLSDTQRATLDEIVDRMRRRRGSGRPAP